MLLDIVTLIENNGPMGVNAIAKQLGYPVSSVHKQLTRRNQKHLVQDEKRKWKLPDTLKDLWSESNLKWLARVVKLNTKENIEELMNDPTITLTDILRVVADYQEVISIYTKQMEFLKKAGSKRV